MLCLFDIALGFWSQQEEELAQVWQDQEACGATVEGGVGRSPRARQWASGLWIVKKSQELSHDPAIFLMFPGACLAENTEIPTILTDLN